MPNQVIRLDKEDLFESTNLISVKKKNISMDIPMHWHTFFELEIILSGQGYQIFNGNKHPLKKGTVSLLKPTDFHAIYPETSLELYNIPFHEDVLPTSLSTFLLQSGDEFIFQLPNDIFDKVQLCTSLLKDEYDNHLPMKDEFIKNLMESIMILLLRYQGTTSALKQTNTTGMKKALLYLHSHFRENPSLATTAELSGYCPNYFSQQFHLYTGQTYIQYLTNLKLNYAKHLLDSCDISTTEVCFECGFTSLSNFLRSFKRHYGISPQIYADQISDQKK